MVLEVIPLYTPLCLTDWPINNKIHSDDNQSKLFFNPKPHCPYNVKKIIRRSSLTNINNCGGKQNQGKVLNSQNQTMPSYHFVCNILHLRCTNLKFGDGYPRTARFSKGSNLDWHK